LHETRVADTPISPSITWAGLGLVRQAAIILAVGWLAWIAAGFYVGDILHFVLDYSEPSFGRLWPNRGWLLVHVVGGTAALFCGPFQLWSGLRRRHLSIHRWTGRFYVGGVLIGGVAAFYLSLFVEPRNFAVALFFLGVAWWVTVGAAVIAIKQHRIEAHKTWMIRGYVVTFAFVTFRWWLNWPFWSALGSDRLAVVAWLSWTVPLLLTEFVVRSRRALPMSRPAE
jgi:Predicted membrane protein (DUF2306)